MDGCKRVLVPSVLIINPDGSKEIEPNPTFTLNSMFFLLYKRLHLTPAVLVYYRFSL